MKPLWLRCAGVLAAAGAALLLMGGLARAQNNDPAVKATCLSNLKQLSMAMLMYAPDSDEVLPPANKWETVLRPYHKSDRILSCPADGQPHSYALNANIAGASMRAVKSPGTTVALFESNQHKPNSAGTKAAVAGPPRHMGGNHYAFVDGHVTLEKTPPDFGKPLPKGRLKKPTPARR
jgi:prepilin-type processing-associated H-X9-DG protein